MPRKPSISCPFEFKPRDNETVILRRIVGQKKFRALQRTFGGRRIWVPKAGKRMPCGLCRRRNLCVHIWHGRGRKVASIARRLSISPKSVYRILGGVRRHGSAAEMPCP